MKLNDLKKFAQSARRKLMGEVSTRLEYLLSHDDAYVRAHEADLKEIRRLLVAKGKEQFVEEVAYTWFNRLVAFRYMDLRGYTKVRVVSPQAGQVQPELLFQIKQGHTPREIQSLQPVFDGYLGGTIQSDQPDREIYTAALLGICNDYSRTLPFLFRRVDAYMAVLLPTDLLSESSILSAVQGAIGEEDVADVEVIGWLYQFYISEKKDEVFGRPKGEKIKKEDIPAATQLFTPHWIVRYMVENSLGRLWRNNRPDTAFAERMEYYIDGDPEPEFLTIEGPEEITLLDPACGSGHILTYAFDLLYGMYEEAGYSAEEIPSLILSKNLYGIDIDTRAAELASFALTMKAREKDRFFFKRGVVPRVVAMEDVTVDPKEAGVEMRPELTEAFGYLSEATNFGSLIPVPAEVQGEIEDILAELDAKGDADLFADQAMAQVRSGLRQLGYLARRYHCVVTNPPYMSTGSVGTSFAAFLSGRYSEGKADLFGAFLILAKSLLGKSGYGALITQQVWLWLPTYSSLRAKLLDESTFVNLLHLGPHGFDSIGGEVVQTAAFVFRNRTRSPDSGCCVFVRLNDASSEKAKRTGFFDKSRYIAKHLREFEALPGRVFGYWLSPGLSRLLAIDPKIREKTVSDGQTKTGNNDRFLRQIWELSINEVGRGKRWALHPKGGGFRRWAGNVDMVIDWSEQARSHYRKDRVARILPEYLWDETGICWNNITMGRPSFRYLAKEEIFNLKAPTVFFHRFDELAAAGAFLNSRVAEKLLEVLSPTLSVNVNEVRSLPMPDATRETTELFLSAVGISWMDWIRDETHFGFLRHGLLTDYSNREKMTTTTIDAAINVDVHCSSLGNDGELSTALFRYEDFWANQASILQELEERNNRYFADLYAVASEIDWAVPLTELSILQNEIVQTGIDRKKVAFSRKEIVRHFVSYGVGCVFGRFSLDKDGLILANAGDDLDAYLAKIPEPTLRPDQSGILPITDDNDFADDLPSQWRSFLRAAFGDEHYEENLRFLEDGLGKRLRPYFLNGFYDDHVKRYKKRPIYWLITSPKGTLQALIYLHRYNRDTVNRFLNDYLRPYQQKLEAKRVSAEHILTGGGSRQSEKTKAQKRIDEIRKALEELSTWERDVVRPLAEKRIELDLDDGVKVNYGKLGAILAKVKGLNA